MGIERLLYEPIEMFRTTNYYEIHKRYVHFNDIKEYCECNGLYYMSDLTFIMMSQLEGDTGQLLNSL